MLNLSGVNALRLPGNWFWWVGSVALRLYYLEASLKGSSLERFPTLSKKKKKTVLKISILLRGQAFVYVGVIACLKHMLPLASVNSGNLICKNFSLWIAHCLNKFA